MRNVKLSLLIALLLVFSGVACTSSCRYGAKSEPGFEVNYEVKVPHEGGNVTPSEAYAMIQKDPEHTFLVDVRTRAEYEFVGHPIGAYHIPFKLSGNELVEKKGKLAYAKPDSPNFAQDLLARFNPAKDTLLFMCRSGTRSCLSSTEAIKAEWPVENIFNILGGFEGDKITDENNPYYGQRKSGGWRNENLPWTYKINKKFVYQPDLSE
jgi:rhodanese-related sulfurtransferase